MWSESGEWAVSKEKSEQGQGRRSHDQAGRAQQVPAAGDWQVSKQTGRNLPDWLGKGLQKNREAEQAGIWAGAEAAARSQHFRAALAWDPWHVTLETQGSGGDRIAKHPQ